MRGDDAPIPEDGRLLRQVAAMRLSVNLHAQLHELAEVLDAPLPTHRASAGGDPIALRGIPVCGVGGAIRGTRPEDCIGRLDRQDKAAARLAVLARGIDGTSPGTQPEQALMDKQPSEGTLTVDAQA